MTEDTRLNVALVGAGDFGRRYLGCLEASHRIELVGIAEINQQTSASLATATQARWYSSLGRVLESEKVDAVIICSPPSAHAADLRVALDAQLPVLVEKPVVTDANGVDLLRTLAEDEKARILPAHVSRHFDAFRWLKGMAQQEEPRLLTAWRYVPRERLGLHGADHPALSAMIHDLDLVQALVGSDIVDLNVMSSRGDAQLRHPDTVIATMRLANGVLVSVGNSWTLPNISRYIDARLTLTTSQRQFSLTVPGSSLVVAGDQGDEFPAPELGITDDGALGGAFQRQLDHFVDFARGQAEPEVTVDDAIWSIELALRIAELAP